MNSGGADSFLYVRFVETLSARLSPRSHSCCFAQSSFARKSNATWATDYPDVERRDIASERLLRAGYSRRLRRNAPFLIAFCFTE
ncbi:hypothetical protein SE91_15545 [Bradyrhizobium sp. DOA1]|nr:hypothetical protein SE91_15545 [Bradyrhizobium sp. DOA1]